MGKVPNASVCRRGQIAVPLALAVGAVLASPVAAKITPTRSAVRIANAITPQSVLYKPTTRFSVIPPDNEPNGISTTPLAGFPKRGNAFAILTNGDVRLADNKNISRSSGRIDSGLTIRGTRDLTVLRIRLKVPSKANCLSIRFKFLSEEFPEFVGSDFNDGFIAEVGRTAFGSLGDSPDLFRDRNFAFDLKGNPIGVNASGPASVSPARAKGTTYDAATRQLRASTRVVPGSRTYLFLSIFDQGDRIYDSAVFLDKITLTGQSTCKGGAVVDP